MDGWVGGWNDGWMDGWMDGMMDGWNKGWMDEIKDEWMDEIKDEWMDGWILYSPNLPKHPQIPPQALTVLYHTLNLPSKVPKTVHLSNYLGHFSHVSLW